MPPFRNLLMYTSFVSERREDMIMHISSCLQIALKEYWSGESLFVLCMGGSQLHLSAQRPFSTHEVTMSCKTDFVIPDCISQTRPGLFDVERMCPKHVEGSREIPASSTVHRLVSPLIGNESLSYYLLNTMRDTPSIIR